MELIFNFFACCLDLFSCYNNKKLTETTDTNYILNTNTEEIINQ